ncbi:MULTISPECIES: chromate transporter [Bacillus]|uniref:ChrA protein n=1 Tax=Bacillus pseudomycoides TaxID=64104 RepID=A0AAJ2DJG6_9BACI|nr:chromate transporter [Bacillus pseudomycoides]KFN16091.1 chromate transporter, chromate ion transporter family protein [Bacillus pseudomycoides]MCR8858367.1 chromate transporter [Bacillus pseudomycoides]MDR4187595.1 chromate transporter [Bacillus pseudomycoides]MDR4324611.1 chromate transporter [Bacillus pseudomycoides]MED0854028.1 chromate transporter [Bacillus pseudomycoides]
MKTIIEIFLVSLKLGLTSFGGPVAHLGYFHHEYVQKRKWMDERGYGDLVALCQFLPGPASSQVGIGIGLSRGGLLGAVVAWIGFTLPSVLVLVFFASLLQQFHVVEAGWIHGLKLVAVAIVAHAIWGMAQKLTPDRNRATIAIITAAIALLFPSAWTQVTLILLAGLLGWLLYRKHEIPSASKTHIPVSRITATLCLLLFFSLLFLLPLLRPFSHWIAMFDSFYRSGSLVFGGGHVVLPLLENEFVLNSMMTKEQFLAGYGLTQAVPGPLFTFASYIGTVLGGALGATIATIAIFLPAFLLVIGVLPFWDQVRRLSYVQGALLGINAAVVGILLAAFYNPIWTSTIMSKTDFVIASLLFCLLAFWKAPPWIVVVLGALSGYILSII